MNFKNIGFIGAGRVTYFILQGFKNAGNITAKITVSDVNKETLKNLKMTFPEVNISENNADAVSQDVVFLSLHPPVINEVLPAIKSSLKTDALFISLAPKFTIQKLSGLLGGFSRITRIIPNAPSIVNSGYNPLAFSDSLSLKEKEQIRTFISVLGECPEVREEDLEAYAILSAMGPTYFWFQLYKLIETGTAFGLNADQAFHTVIKMAEGSIKTMAGSGLDPEQVMDLVPVKPLKEEEENIRKVYEAKLNELFKKLKS